MHNVVTSLPSGTGQAAPRWAAIRRGLRFTLLIGVSVCCGLLLAAPILSTAQAKASGGAVCELVSF